MSDVLEYFVDNVQIMSSPGGATLVLAATIPPTLGSGTKVHCVVRMDLIQAKVMAIQLKKNLMNHEQENGFINLAPKQLETMGIDMAKDWI